MEWRFIKLKFKRLISNKPKTRGDYLTEVSDSISSSLTTEQFNPYEIVLILTKMSVNIKEYIEGLGIEKEKLKNLTEEELVQIKKATERLKTFYE